MKRVIFLFFFLVAFAACLSAQKTYVLAVGINNYGRPNEIPNLQMPTKDAQEFAKVFKQQKAAVGVVTSKYATVDKLTEKINALIKLAKAEDNIILYLSGHGAPGYYVCYGGSPLYYTQLAKQLTEAKTKNVFVFIDACHSGSAQQAVGKDADLAGIEPVFMMACRPTEYSYERGILDNGLFTQALLKAIRGKADYNKDRQITLREAFKYTYNDVTAKTKGEQHPQLIGSSMLFDSVLTRW